MSDWSIFALFGAAVLCSWLMTQARDKKRMAQNLIEATRLMREHREALETFLDHPRAPSDLKRLALDLSDSFEDRTLMVHLAGTLIGDLPSPRPTTNFRETMLALKESDREVHDLFMKASVCGMMAGLFRFEDTCLMIERATTRIAEAPSEEVGVAAATLPPPRRFSASAAFA